MWTLSVVVVLVMWIYAVVVVVVDLLVNLVVNSVFSYATWQQCSLPGGGDGIGTDCC